MNLTIKKIILFVLTGVFSFASWYFLSQLLQTLASGWGANQWNNLALSVVFLGLGAATLFALSLSSDYRYFIPAALIPAAGMLYFLGTSNWMLLAAVVLTGTCLAMIRFPKILQETIRTKFYSATIHFIAVISLAFLASAGIYMYEHQDKLGQNQTIVSKVIDSSWKYIQPLVPEFNSDQTVDQFITQQFQEQGVAKPTQQMIAEGRKQLESQTGLKLTGKEKMSEVGRDFVKVKIQDVVPQEQSQTYLLFVIVLVIWPFLRIVLAGIASLVLRFLRATNFLKTQETQITAKTLVLE